MLTAIVLCVPAVILMIIREKVLGARTAPRLLVMTYPAWFIALNAVMFFLLYCIFQSRGNIFVKLNTYPVFALKYFILAAVLAVLEPLIEKQVRKISRPKETFLNYIRSLFLGIPADRMADRQAVAARRKILLCTAGASLLVFIVSFINIIKSDFGYIDDVRRIYDGGYDGWDLMSRHISSHFSNVIHAGDILTNVAPLTQFIAIGLLVLSCLIVIVQIREAREDAVSVWDVFAAVPLGISPYFLQCISYKYDSPYMAFSVFAAVAPLMFRKKNPVVYCISAFLGTLGVFMSYQSASGIFPMAVLLIALLMWMNREPLKRVFAFLFGSAACYLAGAGVYVGFLMKPVDMYVSNGMVSSAGKIIANYRRYIGLVRTDFRKDWLVLICIIVVWFIAVSVYRSERSKILTLLLSAAVSVCMFVLSFGLYPALSEPLWSPRALCGVGAFIAFVGTGAAIGGKKKWITRLLTVVISWCFITFAAFFGNSLVVQHEYEEFRIREVVSDLTDLDEYVVADERSIVLVGDVGFAPGLDLMRSGSNMLDRLIPPPFGESWWGSYRFFHYYGLPNTEQIAASGFREDYESWPLLQESAYHRIYGRDDVFVIVLLS